MEDNREEGANSTVRVCRDSREVISRAGGSASCLRLRGHALRQLAPTLAVFNASGVTRCPVSRPPSVPTERPLHHSERILEQVLEWSGLESPGSAFLILKKFPVPEKKGRGTPPLLTLTTRLRR